MIEKQIPWTTNLDQLGWAALEFAIILIVITVVVQRCR